MLKSVILSKTFLMISGRSYSSNSSEIVDVESNIVAEVDPECGTAEEQNVTEDDDDTATCWKYSSVSCRNSSVEIVAEYTKHLDDIETTEKIDINNSEEESKKSSCCSIKKCCAIFCATSCFLCTALFGIAYRYLFYHMELSPGVYGLGDGFGRVQMEKMIMNGVQATGIPHYVLNSKEAYQEFMGKHIGQRRRYLQRVTELGEQEAEQYKPLTVLEKLKHQWRIALIAELSNKIRNATEGKTNDTESASFFSQITNTFSFTDTFTDAELYSTDEFKPNTTTPINILEITYEGAIERRWNATEFLAAVEKDPTLGYKRKQCKMSTATTTTTFAAIIGDETNIRNGIRLYNHAKDEFIFHEIDHALEDLSNVETSGAKQAVCVYEYFPYICPPKGALVDWGIQIENIADRWGYENAMDLSDLDEASYNMSRYADEEFYQSGVAAAKALDEFLSSSGMKMEKKSDLFLHGYSMGTGVAPEVASRISGKNSQVELKNLKLEGLILCAPISSGIHVGADGGFVSAILFALLGCSQPEQLGDGCHKSCLSCTKWRTDVMCFANCIIPCLFEDRWNAFDNTKSLKKLDNEIPTLIVHGKSDEVINYVGAERLFTQVAKQRKSWCAWLMCGCCGVRGWSCGSFCESFGNSNFFERVETKEFTYRGRATLVTTTEETVNGVEKVLIDKAGHSNLPEHGADEYVTDFMQRHASENRES